MAIRKILLILVAFSLGTLLYAQSNDPLVSACVLNAGDNAKFLKDFRVQLGKGSPTGDMRYKVNMSLWKNTKYRFTMCNDESSKGQLVITIKDDANKTIFSSFDKEGKIYPSIEFVCNKSGIYQLSYDFYGGEQGLGVGVISMVR